MEIGGFKPYATVNPPAAQLADLGRAHAKFALYLSSLFSRVRIAKAEATALGGGLYRVKADVENTGYLPTAMAHGVLARSVKPVHGAARRAAGRDRDRCREDRVDSGAGRVRLAAVVRVDRQGEARHRRHAQGRLAEKRHATQPTITLK